MSVFIPMTLDFEIVSSSESICFSVENGEQVVERSFNLVLRPDLETQIELDSGESLSCFDVNLTLLTKFKKPGELDADLSTDEIGYVCYTENNGKPFLGGGVIWPLDSLPGGMGSVNTTGRVQLTISNLEAIPEYAPPFAWGKNRQNALHIRAIQLSCVSVTNRQNRQEADI